MTNGKKILVAVDDSKNSLKAVEYLADVVKPTSMVTLFSVLPDITSAYGLDSPSLTPLFNENLQAFRSIENARKSGIEESMERAKKTLLKAGMPAKNVLTKISPKKNGIVRGIMKEAEGGQYDTIVIGRRPLSGVNRFVFSSVSNKVVQLAENMAVIVVD